MPSTWGLICGIRNAKNFCKYTQRPLKVECKSCQVSVTRMVLTLTSTHISEVAKTPQPNTFFSTARVALNIVTHLLIKWG